MKKTLLQPLSDIHLEKRLSPLPIHPDSKNIILILAGDICATDSKNVDRISNFLKTASMYYKEVVYVLGNHEYEYCEWPNGSYEILKSISKTMNNVHILKNDIFVINNVLIIGTTFWPNFWNSVSDASYANQRVNDFCITQKEGKPIIASDYMDQYYKDLDYIKHMCREFPGYKKVVVTHWPPTLKSAGRRDITKDMLAPYFYNDIEEYIDLACPCSVWIHGHTHTAVDYTINKTRIISNPFFELDNKYNPELIIEV